MGKKWNINRVIALTMALVLIFSLFAFDKRFETEAVADAEEVYEIDVDAVFQEDQEETANVYFSGDQVKLTSSNYYLLNVDLNEAAEDQLATDSDATEIPKPELTINNIENKEVQIAIYSQETPNDYYILEGSIQLVCDDDKPVFSTSSINENDKYVEQKTDYILLAESGTLEYTVTVTDATSGVERVVYKTGTSDDNEVTLTPGADNTYTANITEPGSYTFYAYDNVGKETVGDTIIVKKPKTIQSVSVEYCYADTEESAAEKHYLLLPLEKVNATKQSVQVTVTITEKEETEEDEYVADVERTLHYKFGENSEFSVDFTNNQATFEIPANQASTSESTNRVSMWIENEFGEEEYLQSNGEGHIIFVEKESPSLSVSNITVRDEVISYDSYDALENKWTPNAKITFTATGSGAFIQEVGYKVDNQEYALNDANTDAFVCDNTIELAKGVLADGENNITIYAKDYFGKSKEEIVTLNIDATAPDVEITSQANNKSVDEVEKTLTYNNNTYYVLANSDASETITINASDESSGVEKLKVKINDTEVTVEGNTYSFTKTESGFYNVSVSAVDKAGNESEVKTFGFMINEEPVVTALKAEVDTESEPLGESGAIIHTNKSNVKVTYTATGLGLREEDITVCNQVIDWEDAVITEDADNSDIKTVTIVGTLPDEENMYDIGFSVKKPGTEITTDDTISITYDKTAPYDITVTAVEPYGTVEGTGTYYFNCTPAIYVEVKDNFSIDTFKIADNQTPQNCWTDTTDATEGDGYVEIAKHSLELTDAVENTPFQLTLTATDKAGNPKEVSIDRKFVYDTVAPELSVSGVNYWNSEKVQLNISASDDFYITKLETEVYCDDVLIESLSGEQTVTPATTDLNTSLSYSYNGKYKVTITAYDAAGNPSESITRNFVVDNTVPAVTWSGIPENPSQSNQDVTVKFSITDDYGIDPTNTDTGNASRVVITRYYTTYDGVTGKDTVSINKVSGKEISATSLCGQMNGKACSYYFEVEVRDNAGNSKPTMKTPTFYVDETAPDFTVSPLPSKTNDGYYNSAVSFNVSIKEQYALAHSISIVDKNASVNGNSCVTLSKNTINGTTGTSSVSVDTSNGTTSGTFALEITVTDAFGNKTTKDISFVIDKKKPVIAITAIPDVNRDSVTFRANISDDYKDGSYKIAVVRKDASGREVYRNDNYKNGTWKDTANLNLAETFSEEGDYTITVTAVDKAGNEAETKSVSFRIDKTAPVLSITGVNDTQTSGCTATFSISEDFDLSYKNSNQNTDVSVTITKKTDGSAESTIATLGYGDFSSGKPHTASYSFNEDGDYTITFNATDASGNKAATVTKTFKIDATAPTLAVSVTDKNAKTVQSYEAIGGQSLEDLNYVVMDVSVLETFFATNTVTFKVLKDGTDVSSQYFTEYRNSGETSNVIQTFEEDGVYNISISAVDELGNAAEDYSIVFKVDNTAPEVEATSVLSAFKSKADANGDILLNGDDFADILNKGYEALWNVNDTSVFTVDVKMDNVDFVDFSDLTDGYHKLTITVTDEVGHVSVQEFEFTYDGTAPRIIISGVEDGQIMHDSFKLTISLEDEEDTITKILINGETIDPALYQDTNRYEFNVEEYGNYEIMVEAVDAAGNVSSTYDSETGEIFSFQLKEKTSPVLYIIIILVIILLLALIIILIIRNRKKKNV